MVLFLNRMYQFDIRRILRNRRRCRRRRRR